LEQKTLPIVGESLLSVCQAARILGRSPDRVRQYADAQVLKCFRFGAKRERVFAPQDVDEFKKLLDGNAVLREASWTVRASVAARRS